MIHHALSNKDVVATIAVRDMDRAQDFYENKLGLKKIKSQSMEDAATYQAGDNNLFVYKSDYAGGYGATVATWTVGDDIEDVVKKLKANGVTFEHYDNLGMDIDGDLHTSGDFKAAWFKDPDGSIIALIGS